MVSRYIICGALICWFGFVYKNHGLARGLVTDETIEGQKKLTQTYILENGIPVLYRYVPNSEILHVKVIYQFGEAHLDPDNKALSDLIFASLLQESKEFSKKNTFTLMERYALDMGCQGGIEYSSCDIDTVNDYHQEALKLFFSLLKDPKFVPADLKVHQEKLVAALKNQISDPSSYVNEVVNRVFYPKDHPYFSLIEQKLKKTPQFKVSDLYDLYGKVFNAAMLKVVVVGSLDSKKLIQMFNGTIGKVKQGKVWPLKVQDPPFNPKLRFSIEDREVPTAYMRIKYNAPSRKSKNQYTAMLLAQILDEQLAEEVRTKRSLSYSIWSGYLRNTIGIGVMGASTPKPKETLQAIRVVLEQLKKKRFTHEQLDEYRRIFATSFYLRQETHASLADFLGQALVYYRDPLEAYYFPKKLDMVSPSDIQDLAQKILKNFRIGVIFPKTKFKASWLDELEK